MIFLLLLSDNNPSERHRIEETLRFKENILQTYRKQLDARRALLDLDNALMDIKHESTRNETTIEQYVLFYSQKEEKTQTCLFFFLLSSFSKRYEANKENSPRSKKLSDENSTDSIVSETSAQRARAELRVLEQERSKIEKQRKIQLKEFETAKSDARRLLDVN